MRTIVDVADSIEDYEGVALSRFEALTTLHVWTRNSHYRLIVLDKSEVMVQGGAAFPAPTRARLEGARLGKTLSRPGWIGVGLQMELRAGSIAIRTSPVVAIARERQPPVVH